MKKVFTFVALTLGLISVANAQYEPEKGDFSVEVGFTPFNTGGDAFKLNEGMMKARWFVSDKDALRLKLGIGIDNKSTTSSQSQDAPSNITGSYEIWESTTTNKFKYADFSFMLGYERHLFTKGRFDVYAGMELGYGMSKYSGSYAESRTGTWYDKNGVKTSSSIKENTKEYINYNLMNENSEDDPETRSKKYFSANLFAGVDFYVWKNLYLGAECGLNFKTGKCPNKYYNSDNYSVTYQANGVVESEVRTTYDGSTNTTITTTKGVPGTPQKGIKKSNEASGTQFNLYVEPAIRIGWRF